MGDTKDTEVVLILKYKFDKDQKTYQNFRSAVLASPPGQRAMKNHALSQNPGRTGLVTGAKFFVWEKCPLHEGHHFVIRKCDYEELDDFIQKHWKEHYQSTPPSCYSVNKERRLTWERKRTGQNSLFRTL